MNFRKLLLTDSEGNKSATLTVFIVGSILVSVKMFFSGLTISTFTLGTFSGVDFAASLVALGGIYILRRTKGTNNDKESK